MRLPNRRDPAKALPTGPGFHPGSGWEQSRQAVTELEVSGSSLITAVATTASLPPFDPVYDQATPLLPVVALAVPGFAPVTAKLTVTPGSGEPYGSNSVASNVWVLPTP